MKKHYTILISSNDQKDSVRELNIKASWVKGGVIGVLVIGSLLGAFGLDYGFVFFKHFNFKKSFRENQALKKKIHQMNGKLKTIQSRLDQIEDFSYQLKVLTGVEDLNSHHLTSLNASLNGRGGGPLTRPQKILNPVEHEESIKPKQSIDRVVTNMNQLNKRSQLIQQDIYQLLQTLYTKQDMMSSTPSIIPVKGWISSQFGWRQYPLSQEVSLHEGIDIAALPGTPVYAPADGEIIFAGYKPGYGKVIIVDHGWELSTLYGHLSEIMVTNKQTIKRRQVIGVTGNTGHSSGPHLHYEVRIAGVPVDPTNYILNQF